MATRPTPLPPAPDYAQRSRALDPTRSFLVQAPAGSGKTELLIQRYLNLLARVNEPEAIAAITFTIKAAAEMRARVLAALASAEQPAPTEPHKLATWHLACAALEQDRIRDWRLRDSPTRLRMVTIDALCLSIARRLPLLAGFGGLPEVDDKAGPLYARAAQNTVLLLDDPQIAPLLKTLLHHLGNDLKNLAALFQQMLERRDHWLRLIGAAQPDEVRHELEQHLRAFPGLAETAYTDAEWEMLQALLALLPHAINELKAEFRRTGRVDFIELALAAREALGPDEHPTDLALALGDRIEHLLIDEMQDTNRTHLEVIRRLIRDWPHADPSDPRTLFLVGDPMQSIYRFRQADVTIFEEQRVPTAAIFPMEPVYLTANFRSQQGIVDWVNHAFPQVFDAAPDAATAAVAYAPSTAIHPPSTTPAVRIHPIVGEDVDAEATLVADLVQRALAHDKKERVAILVRTRNHTIQIVAELKRRNIGFRAIDIDALAQRPVIADLAALTRALLHPADRANWLAVLRAPWCGLKLEDLWLMGTKQTIAEAMDDVATLSADAQRRLARIRPALQAALAAARRIPVRELIEQTWIALGGPHTLTRPEAHADARAFFQLVAELDAGGYLTSFAELEARLYDLFSQPDPNADGRLEIMTIHKAKGLEFDTVIVPRMAGKSKPDGNELLNWTTLGNHVLAAPVPSQWQDDRPILDQIRRIEKDHEKQEIKRLLYVAATRAKRQLHLIGPLKLTTKGAWYKAGTDTLLGHLWPVVEAEYVRVLSNHQTAAPPQQTGFAFPEQRTIQRLPLTLAAPPAPALVQPGPEWVTFAWVGETLRHVGKTVHAWLQRMADDVHAIPNCEVIERALIHAGVSQTDLDFATTRTLRALESTLNDERGRWILERRQTDHREYAITGIVNGSPIRGVVDCTFIDQGTRWIIDFKTSYHEGTGMEAFLDNERLRYEAQLGRYATLLRNLGPEPVKLGLYFPLLQAWREWDAE
jgi:ATP-dependent helicase/nuclease subunit A